MTDTTVSIHPYFNVSNENLPAFRELTAQLIERAQTEDGCLYYGFSYLENTVFCREAYRDADAALVHLGNVGDLIEKALQISEITRAEVHGPAAELEKLNATLAPMGFQFYTLESGFKK